MMKDKRILYWLVLACWGFGQAIAWLIGHTIATSVLVGDIGGVIYSDNTIGLVIIGVGGLIGGLMNGILLLRAIAIGFGTNRAREINLFLFVAGWVMAYMVKEIAFSLVTVSNGGLFYGFLICSSVVFGNLIAAGVGGGLTMIALDHSLADSLTGVLGWAVGMILGSFAGLFVSDYLFTHISFSVPFIMQSAISNSVGGFVNGSISAMIGGGVMAWLEQKNHLSKVMEPF